jgi:hypothetical protein
MRYTDLVAEFLQNARTHQESAEHALEVKDVDHWCLGAVVNVDSPRLVAALDAVLKQVASAKATGTMTCDCPDCITARQNGFTGVHRPQPYRWDLSPAKVREAITAALAGKKAGASHDERCCMTGNPPGSGPHPDCPGYPYWPDEEAGDGG